MNVLIERSSSLLGSSLINFFFDKGFSITTCEKSCNNSKTVKPPKDNTIIKNKDIIVLVHGFEELLSCAHSFQIRNKSKAQQSARRGMYEEILKSQDRPKVIISLSSLYVYGSNTNVQVAEDQEVGNDDFLASHFTELERASEVLSDTNTRVVHLRIGELISKSHSFTLFQHPLCNRPITFIQRERQSVNWVGIEDTLRAIQFILDDESLNGPINITSGENLVKNELISELSSKGLSKKPLAIPRVIFKSLFGKEMTDIHSASCNAIPFRLLENGFLFENISIHEYLNSV